MLKVKASRAQEYEIIFFDGICNLCNKAVNFIIDRDQKGRYKFASLQGETGQRFLAERGLNQQDFDSIILSVPSEAYYTKSDAVLEIAKGLGGLYSLMGIFSILPIGIRDGIYDWVARNRYQWYGKRQQCRIPTPELKSRFID